MHLSPTDLARKYFVDDLPGATIPGARLYGILERIDAGGNLSAIALYFLEQSKLGALHDLATGTSDFEAFYHRSKVEMAARIAAAKVKAEAAAAERAQKAAAMAAAVKIRFEAMENEPVLRRKREAAERAQKAAAMAAAVKIRFEAMENDPDLRRKREARELRERYGLGFVDPDHYPRVMKLLKQLDAERRLTPEDVAWLSTAAEDCWTDKLRAAYHRLEAKAHADEWRRTDDPWAAVNASGRWRKADEPNEALEITDAALARAGSAPKIRSALYTTRGGAMRDLGRLAEAKDLGHEAHELAPNDFRPCTLLGAVAMQLGDFQTGHEWYRKAEGLGAERHAIDQDLRGGFARATPDVRAGLSAFLLSQDEQRFAWVRAK